LEPIRSFDCALDLFTIGKRAVMNVGKLHDAKAVKSFRQLVQLDPLMLDAEHVGLGEGGTSNMGQTKSQ
jgi:hypothetical protein